MYHGPDDWGGGAWWWMGLMMIVFWGGIILLAVMLIRREHHHAQPQAATTLPAPRATPEQILAERLARGEIAPDEYRQRLAALTASGSG